MNSTLYLVFIGALTLAYMGCLFYLLFKLYQEKGFLHAFLGFIFPIYPFFWGWIKARELEILDIMVFWTIITLFSCVVPFILGFMGASQMIPGMMPMGDFSSEMLSGSSEVVSRGPIAPGSQVAGQIDDPFGTDAYTMAGSAGQTVTIWAQAAQGSSTDPQLTVYGPNGAEVGYDDDGGGGTMALISGLYLPADGTYTIYVDVWSTGPYVLGVE